ncbi:MAG TPA: ATP-binding protein [Vicinamibacteria bacterium]|nr:ATP-binding protein [Vicinamibacteria bacterium]
MALRLNSLKTRTALAIASVIVATLVLNAVYLILTKRAELRAQIEHEAQTFAQLTKSPLARGWEDFDTKNFRLLVREHMRLNTDVRRLQIVRVDGRINFDSALRSFMDAPTPPKVWPDFGRLDDPALLEAVRELETTRVRGRGASGEEVLRIVTPHFEDWGRHKVSLVYHVSYDSLDAKLRGLLYAIGGLTLFSLLFSAGLAVALARRITRPLEELTAGAQGIAEGRFDQRLSIRSHDEIEILADSFNHMTERLQEIIRQLEESNRKLGAANDDLKELDRMKSDLLANVSHELRTPLTAIKGYTDYMLERKLGPVSEKQEKGLVVMQRNLDRLSRSISALLDFSRMDVGRLPLNLQPFALAPLVEQIVTIFRSELEKKRLTFSADLDPDLAPVIADREKLSAVLENLVVNAIKFTPEGGRVTLSARRDPSAPRPSVEISVADTGVGIPPDQVEKVFTRFHQVDTSTTRRFGGVGLGLAIVKSIVEAHGSAIAVDSEPGRGSVFRFSLPVLEKQDAAGRDERRDDGESALVLVLEPETATADLIRDTLRSEGFRAAVVPDGRQALEAMERERPGLVVLDASRPDPDGLEGIPRAYLKRPLDVRALLSEVRRHVGSQGREIARRASV